MTDFDVLIVGAGPAGSGAARLLAAWGHRVLVVDRPRKDDRSLGESIPPSAKKVLAALGMLSAIEDAGFPPWQGNVVWWSPGSDELAPRVESFPPGVAGFQVVRREFDARLRALAAEAGATMETGIVHDVNLDPPRARIEAGGHAREVSASMVLDCSGRAGTLARQGLRRQDESRHTVALVGVWRNENDLGGRFRRASGGNDPRGRFHFQTETLVAAYADGWAWSVPVAADKRYITVMVDPQRTALARGVPASDVYRDELAKVAAFHPLTAEGALIEGPWGADASGYRADRYAGPGFLLVGDAASFIDPLSSFGVKKALASAWLAAIVSHTCLVRPSMADAALAFFDQRERAIYLSARQQASTFAAEAAAQTGHAFWIARADTPDSLDPGAEVDVTALAQDAAVLAAFEELRRRPAVHFRTGDRVAIRPRAAVRGREIVLEDHVFLPEWPGGVRYLRDVDLVTILQRAPAFEDIGELAEAYGREHGPVALPDLLGAIATLVAKGALVYG